MRSGSYSADMKSTQNQQTIERNLGECVTEEQVLSDGSKVYNVAIPAQVIYCRSQLHAINFVTDLSEAIARAQ